LPTDEVVGELEENDVEVRGLRLAKKYQRVENQQGVITQELEIGSATFLYHENRRFFGEVVLVELRVERGGFSSRSRGDLLLMRIPLVIVEIGVVGWILKDFLCRVHQLRGLRHE